MNKFKVNILALGVVGLLGMSSCSESFLDVNSMTNSNTDNFYKTEADAWRALIGCYNGWRQTSTAPGIGFYVASTVMGDECYGGTGNSDARNYQVIDRFDQSESPADLQMYAQDWKMYYQGVYRCNELITREDQIKWKDKDSNRGLYMGECHALRAFLYFDMVRLWGNIPLFLEPVNENRSQADPAEVYAAIFEDLKYAIANIPGDANLEKSQFGRITKYAAEAILARAYLYYTGYYGQEPGFTNESGETTGVVTKAEASTYAGDANSEVVLSMNFTPMASYATEGSGSADGNRWQVMMGMRSPLSVVPYYCGWGACTVIPSFINSIYDAADPRRTAGVIDIAGEGIGSDANFKPSYNDWREYTGYTVKKYSPIAFYQLENGALVIKNANMSTGAGDMQINNCQPYNIIRYADVLLMAAELGSPQAATYMHRIRSRAGLSDIPVNKENIMAERARELAFEGIRYWDLLRQGVEVMADAVVASAGSVQNGGSPAQVSYNRNKIIATKGLSQIPNDQIILSNGVLKQNPGWAD